MYTHRSVSASTGQAGTHGIAALSTYRSLVSCLYRACIDHLSRYSILNVSNVYRNGIEKRYSIEVPMEPKTYRVCIERVSNKKCLDTVSRVVSTKSRYTFDTLRYTTIQYDTFMGKIHPDTWGKWLRRPRRPCGVTWREGDWRGVLSAL